MVAFVGGVSVGKARVSSTARCARRTVRVFAEEESAKPLVALSTEEQAEKDEIMAALAAETQERVILPNNRNLGATVDQDGKSNIWAVEPKVTVDETDNKAIIVAGVVAVILAGVAILPQLPLISPDAY